MPEPQPARKHGYGVRLVRGPFVKLEPHPRHTDDEEELLALSAELKGAGFRLAADLFSGAGGLSLGLEEAGFRVVLGVDCDDSARRTHAHHFAGMSVGWDLAEAGNVERVADLCRRAGVELIAGGPPCQPFSRAGRSKIRHRVEAGLRDPYDERRDLWRSFLEVVTNALPAAVVMENVPDMALDREMFIFRSIVEELEQCGYCVEARIVEAWRYGVPQLRQRLIVVALRDNQRFVWPPESSSPVTVLDAIGDLPEVRGGWRPEGGANGWTHYGGPKSDFQRHMRRGVKAQDAEKIFDQITRPVRDDDRAVFEAMTPQTKYADIDKEHQRYRADIFDDKYHRLDPNKPSRTVTAHIAKDGYWYIHPFQPRTLTVREAARLQTFPDNFRFDGPPSAAFRQIGNAVPPRLGFVLGLAVLDALNAGRPGPPSTRDTAARLAVWAEGHRDTAAVPWLWAPNRWAFLVAEYLLARCAPPFVQSAWPQVASLACPPLVDDAGHYLDEARVVHLGSWLDRDGRAKRVVELALAAAGNPGALKGGADEIRQAFGVPSAIADLCVLAVPSEDTDPVDDGEEPVLVSRGVLRVVRRYRAAESDRANRLTVGRLGVARMIGLGAGSRDAHRALIELAGSLCLSDLPMCSLCPLSPECERNGVAEDLQTVLL